MGKVTSKVVRIVHRRTGSVASVLDVTGWSDREFDRMWDGLVMKVDFETWMPVYSPERGDDETVAEWLAR